MVRAKNFDRFLSVVGCKDFHPAAAQRFTGNPADHVFVIHNQHDGSRRNTRELRSALNSSESFRFFCSRKKYQEGTAMPRRAVYA